MNASLKKNIGNLLIVLSLAGFLFIYYPYVKELLFPAKITTEQRQSINFSIEIPSLQVFSSVVPNVDPFNQAEYLESLKKGVAHAAGTSLPGEKGTIYLFAHSSDVPWRITRYNTAFFKLEQVKTGEEIIVRNKGKVFKYKVFDKKTVWPNEVKYLKENQGDILILQTCAPVGTSLMRLLVFAKPSA